MYTKGKLISRQKRSNNIYEYILYAENGRDSMAELDGDNAALNEANAARLTLCWNCHDELLEACKTALKLLEDNQGEARWYLKKHFNQLQAAILAAEKE